MCADFVTGCDDHASLVGKGFDGVPRDEPGGLEAMLVKELEQAGDANLTGEEATRDVVGRVFSTIRAEPPTHSINVNTVSDFNIFRAHNCSSLLLSLTLSAVARVGGEDIPAQVGFSPASRANHSISPSISLKPAVLRYHPTVALVKRRCWLLLHSAPFWRRR